MLRNRALHVALGALAGLAGWVLAEILAEIAAARTVLGLATLGAAFFGVVLAMLTDVAPRRAIAAGAGVAGVTAALVVLGSLRFDDPQDFVAAGHGVLAELVLASLPVPFLMAVARGGRGAWADYPALFLHSWNIVVRYAAAALFVGVVWAVLILSGALLRLVGIEALANLLEEPLAIWLISGAALGLGLAVVGELSDLVSPYLMLRLLRLLLPVVLVVVLVFLAALPLRGLSGLFGNLSPGAMFMAMAAVAVGLIAIAVDQSEAEAVQGRLMQTMVRALALTVPVLAGLAVWAMALRVVQYGWTPGRVAAACGAGVSLGYGLAYALAVLRGARWMGHIRRANIGLALGLIVLAALWQTPLLNAQAIAAQSQQARYAEDRAMPEQMPLWELAHDWGRPGLAVLAELRDVAALPGQEALARRFAAMDQAPQRWEFDDPGRTPIGAARAVGLAAALPVWPEGRSAPEGLLESLSAPEGQMVLEACARTTPAGNPGCLLLLADLVPQRDGDEAVIVLSSGGRTRGVVTLVFAREGAGWTTPDSRSDGEGPEAGRAIDLIRQEGVTLVPLGLSALQFGDRRIFLYP